MILRQLVSLGCIALSASAMSAQSLVDQQADSTMYSHRIVTLDDGRIRSEYTYDPAVRDRFVSFYYDQFRNAQDPEAPYFMFMSKTGDMMMGIGGVVRMRAWYDWGGSIPANGFAPILIPMSPDPATRRHLGTTPAGTCLFFRMAGKSKVLGDYQVYIEANFNGWQGRDFHLKKAYATVRDFTVGYASSTFSDPAAVPSTIDAAGPNNKLSATNVLVRWMPHITQNWIAAVSVEAPDMHIGADNVSTKACSQYLPDFAAFMQYEWNRGQHVRLAGVVRSLPYRDLVEAKNHNLAGWGVQLSSVNHPARPLTTYVTVNYGAGYAGLGGDLLAGAYDLLNDPDIAGQMYAPRSMGWCVGVQYNFRPDLFMTVIGSQNRLWAQKAVSPDEYKYGLLGMVNIFWNPVPRVQLGAEFDIARRQNFSGDHRYGRRIGIMGQVSF
ncbi:MAG: hypothetical protein Q4C34_00370 [Bacteroidales bacterium]|nr:hypothetical protein [Bacteroidales bacterium]